MFPSINSSLNNSNSIDNSNSNSISLSRSRARSRDPAGSSLVAAPLVRAALASVSRAVVLRAACRGRF